MGCTGWYCPSPSDLVYRAKEIALAELELFDPQRTKTTVVLSYTAKGDDDVSRRHAGARRAGAQTPRLAA